MKPIKSETIVSHDPTHKRITVKEFIKNLQRCPLDATVQIESNVLVKDVTDWVEEEQTNSNGISPKWVSFTHNAHKLIKEGNDEVQIEITTTASESSGCSY